VIGQDAELALPFAHAVRRSIQGQHPNTPIPARQSRAQAIRPIFTCTDSLTLAISLPSGPSINATHGGVKKQACSESTPHARAISRRFLMGSGPREANISLTMRTGCLHVEPSRCEDHLPESGKRSSRNYCQHARRRPNKIPVLSVTSLFFSFRTVTSRI